MHGPRSTVLGSRLPPPRPRIKFRGPCRVGHEQGTRPPGPRAFGPRAAHRALGVRAVVLGPWGVAMRRRAHGQTKLPNEKRASPTKPLRRTRCHPRKGGWEVVELGPWAEKRPSNPLGVRLSARGARTLALGTRLMILGPRHVETGARSMVHGARATELGSRALVPRHVPPFEPNTGQPSPKGPDRKRGGATPSKDPERKDVAQGPIPPF